MARDCKGNSIFRIAKFLTGIFTGNYRRILKEPYATFAHLRLNKDLNLGPHD